MSRTYLRGDMYYADLGRSIGSEQEGYRPVVIIQNNKGNKHSPTVIVAAISSRFEEWYAVRPSMDDTYSAAEVAAMMGVHRNTVYDLIAKGLFKTERYNDRPRIDKESFDSHAAAKKRKAEIEHQQNTNTFIVPSDLTLSDLLDQYVTIYGINTWAPSTYKGHKSLIGDRKLDDINPWIMDHFYKQLKTVKAKARPYGVSKDGFITPRTIKEIHKAQFCP